DYYCQVYGSRAVLF
nr:immunoglobulin light chain junction region [Macaca mulatta]MOX13387.1 immunoglobulin light chain junction region [Macaca mulatta]MOX13825.1 immunoglobulin light chain junction region [Macaca mulatta]